MKHYSKEIVVETDSEVLLDALFDTNENGFSIGFSIDDDHYVLDIKVKNKEFIKKFKDLFRLREVI